jgi:hypothetical protein
MDEVQSVHDAENESFVGGQNDDDEEDEVPAPKRLRREVAALHTSSPPVASSSKPRPTASPLKTQPVASSSKIPPPKMDVPYVAVPSSDHKVSSHLFKTYIFANFSSTGSASARLRLLTTVHSRSLRHLLRLYTLLLPNFRCRRRRIRCVWICYMRCRCALPVVSPCLTHFAPQTDLLLRMGPF